MNLSAWCSIVHVCFFAVVLFLMLVIHHRVCMRIYRTMFFPKFSIEGSSFTSGKHSTHVGYIEHTCNLRNFPLNFTFSFYDHHSFIPPAARISKPPGGSPKAPFLPFSNFVLFRETIHTSHRERRWYGKMGRERTVIVIHHLYVTQSIPV